MLFSIPAAHSFIVILIKDKRWGIADNMNAGFAQVEVSQHSQPVPCIDLEIQNMSRNSNASEQQVLVGRQNSKVSVVEHSNFNSANMNKEVDSRTEEQMHDSMHGTYLSNTKQINKL